MTNSERVTKLWKEYKFRPNQIQEIKARANDELLNDKKLKAIADANMMLPPVATCAQLLISAFYVHKEGRLVSQQTLFDELRNNSVFRPTDTPEANMNRVHESLKHIDMGPDLDAFNTYISVNTLPVIEKLLKQLYAEEDAIAKRLADISEEYIKAERVKRVVAKA